MRGFPKLTHSGNVLLLDGLKWIVIENASLLAKKKISLFVYAFLYLECVFSFLEYRSCQFQLTFGFLLLNFDNLDKLLSGVLDNLHFVFDFLLDGITCQD